MILWSIPHAKKCKKILTPGHHIWSVLDEASINNSCPTHDFWRVFWLRSRSENLPSANTFWSYFDAKKSISQAMLFWMVFD
jgi:hypothetical protein